MVCAAALAILGMQAKPLPKVLIIGDSISIGYTPFVKEKLKDEAIVIHNPGNGGPTTKGLANIEAWIGDEDWAVIHFNFGLHDLAYRPEGKGGLDKKRGFVSTKLHDYEANLDTLSKRLLRTDAKIIFALTTPVPPGEPGRYVEDAVRYNHTATKVMKKNKIPINDLHKLILPKMSNLATRPGNVHFKSEGSELLADQVVKYIREALKS
jgi:hypothetical protein